MTVNGRHIADSAILTQHVTTPGPPLIGPAAWHASLIESVALSSRPWCTCTYRDFEPHVSSQSQKLEQISTAIAVIPTEPWLVKASKESSKTNGMFQRHARARVHAYMDAVGKPPETTGKHFNYSCSS